MALPVDENHLFFFDALYCGEEGVLFAWEEELERMMNKEDDGRDGYDYSSLIDEPFLKASRSHAVNWVIMVSARHGFFNATAVVAVNYLDRFLSICRLPREEPWMFQLVSVASLSLAAKVEETRVPLLVDLQLKESDFVFEAKTIQRMELLMLSSLRWKMNPVTPYSFLRHISMRFGLSKTQFMFRCDRILLSVIADSQFLGYPPSVIAIALMTLAVKQIEPGRVVNFRDRVMSVFKHSKDRVDECCKMMSRICRNPKRSDLCFGADLVSCGRNNDVEDSTIDQPPLKKAKLQLN